MVHGNLFITTLTKDFAELATRKYYFIIDDATLSFRSSRFLDYR